LGERIWKRLVEIKGARRIKRETKINGTDSITIKAKRITTLKIEIQGRSIEVENTRGEKEGRKIIIKRK